MASMTLTLPADMASPAAALSFCSAYDVILALDLGATTGFAIAGVDGGITSGTAEFRLDRWQSGGMRFLRFKRWLTEDQAPGRWFRPGRLRTGPPSRRRRCFARVWRLAGDPDGLVRSPRHRLPGRAVGTIKRHVTGKGNADKAAVIDAVRARGFKPADDNEADALATLLWAIETQGGVR